MKVEKEKRKVTIFCTDGSIVKGYVYINPGCRLLDFMNDHDDRFFAVTSAEFSNIKEVHSFKLYNELTKKRNLIILNKASVKLIEETQDRKGD